MISMAREAQTERLKLRSVKATEKSSPGNLMRLLVSPIKSKKRAGVQLSGGVLA